MLEDTCVAGAVDEVCGKGQKGECLSSNREREREAIARQTSIAVAIIAETKLAKKKEEKKSADERIRKDEMRDIIQCQY